MVLGPTVSGPTVSGPTPAEPGTRPARVAAAVGAVLLALVAAVVGLSLQPVAFVNAPPPLPIGPRPEAPVRTGGPGQSAGTFVGTPYDWPLWLVIMTQAAVTALGLALAWLLWLALRRAFTRWHRRFARRRHRPSQPGDVVVLPEVPVPDGLGAAEAQTRRVDLLSAGSPRNAIVACWIDLEESTVAAGLSRLNTETAAEYVERVLGTWAVDPVALAELAELFREARYSGHPISEAQRDQARSALTRVHADLAAAQTAPPGGHP